MKSFLAVVLASLFVVTAFSEDLKPDPRTQLLANLNRIETLYLSRLSGRELQEAVRLLNETRGIVVGLQAAPQAPEPAAVDNRLSDESFQALLEAVRKENFDQYRTKVIVSVLGKKGRLTVAQVRSLVQLFDNDAGKKDVLIAVRDNVIDPVNISLILQNFAFSSYRDQVLKAYQDQ